MQIICPHCQLKNDIEFSEHIRCKGCEKNFKHHTFSIRTITKPLIVGTSAVLLTGGIIGYKLENYLDQVRYPIHFEYAIITHCANPNRGYLSQKDLERNIKICSCALENTIKDVGYKEVIDEELRKSFSNHLSKCRLKI